MSASISDRVTAHHETADGEAGSTSDDGTDTASRTAPPASTTATAYYHWLIADRAWRFALTRDGADEDPDAPAWLEAALRKRDAALYVVETEAGSPLDLAMWNYVWWQEYGPGAVGVEIPGPDADPDNHPEPTAVREARKIRHIVGDETWPRSVGRLPTGPEAPPRLAASLTAGSTNARSGEPVVHKTSQNRETLPMANEYEDETPAATPVDRSPTMIAYHNWVVADRTWRRELTIAGITDDRSENPAWWQSAGRRRAAAWAVISTDPRTIPDLAAWLAVWWKDMDIAVGAMIPGEGKDLADVLDPAIFASDPTLAAFARTLRDGIGARNWLRFIAPDPPGPDRYPVPD